MQDLRWVQMTEEELSEFLGRGGTGIISFTTEATDPPFTIPVSYGYDADSATFYYRLSFPPESGKEDFIDNPVAFVTYDQVDEKYRSVVATGHLEEVTDMPYNSAAIQRMWSIQIPMVDIFDQPPENISFRHFRLVPDTVAGRKEVKSQP
ncbi:pyridoxamine 5'-phosphate oxidase family protein [Haladaptatus sp. DFWS20]|uniref:pyridoxamine 5'-phosphate oxidase family protein n=1 Tax=Haladaptatus sp. DFWS20 TaxID=3403467 RepID=UPI003EB8BA14